MVKDFTSPSNRFIIMLNYLILFTMVLIVIIPISVIFIASFKTNQEFMTSSIINLPDSFSNFDNYLAVIKKGHLLRGFVNTGLLITIPLCVSVITGLMVSYVIGRFKFKGRKLLFNLFMFASVIPYVTTQVSTFNIIKSLGLYNTIYSGMLLYSGTNIIQIYIFLQFIINIPTELDESGLVDGASYFRIFASIIVPLMKPAIVTVVILKMLLIYNDMYIPYLYMPKSTLNTVTTSIMRFSQDQNSQWNVMSAGIIAVMIPTMLIYLILQKHIISGVTSGAVKS